MAQLDLVAGQPWLLAKGAFIGAAPTVNIETQFQGMKMFAGGEGAFLMQVDGEGPLVVSSFGALDRFTLQEGQSVVVDSGHFVAAHMSVRYQLRRASAAGYIQSAKSGEGLVFEFEGPGEVLMQSRNPSGLVKYLSANGLGSRS